MENLTFDQFMSILDKLSDDDKYNIFNQLKKYPENYLSKYCFFKIKNMKVQIIPKISIIPSYKEQPFNGDKEIKKTYI